MQYPFTAASGPSIHSILLWKSEDTFHKSSCARPFCPTRSAGKKWATCLFFASVGLSWNCEGRRQSSAHKRLTPSIAIYCSMCLDRSLRLNLHFEIRMYYKLRVLCWSLCLLTNVITNGLPVAAGVLVVFSMIVTSSRFISVVQFLGSLHLLDMLFSSMLTYLLS